jgi:hypothetical protein
MEQINELIRHLSALACASALKRTYDEVPDGPGFETAHAALWDLDEAIIDCPADTLKALAIKAQIVAARTDNDGPHPDFTARLVADVIALAAGASSQRCAA